MGKRFVVLALLLASMLFVTFSYIVFNYQMYYMNHEYPMWVHVKETILIKNKEKQNLIMIGDSRAKAGFIPAVNSKINSLNLAVGGGTPIEGYFILKKYLENNPPPNKIVISYAPGHLETAATYWERTVKFNLLNEEEYQEVETNAKEINDSKTLGLSKTYKDYLNPAKFTTDVKNGIIAMRWKQNEKMLHDGFSSKGHYFFGTEAYANGLTGETQITFKRSQLIDLYMQKLLRLSKQNDIQVYYYSMPLNENSFKASKETYRNGYSIYLQDLLHKYHVSICNDLGYMSNDNFGDPSHLYKGAEKVSHDIFNCVDDENSSAKLRTQ